MRVWPLHLRETGGGSVCTVSQRFQGPAVIAELVIGFLNGGNNPLPDLRIYVAQDNSGGTTTGTLAIEPSGDHIFDLGGTASDAAANQPQSGARWTVENIGGAQNGPNTIRLGIPVTLAEFFLKVRIASPAALSVFVGALRVVEGLSIEDLPNFL